MNIKKYIYIVAFIATILSSCKDDFLYSGGVSQEDIDEVLKDGYSFGFLLEDPAAKTRDVNFNPGASVRINSVWMGVFDKESGDCVSNNYRDLDYATAVSGTLQTGIVRMALTAPKDPNNTGKNYDENNDLIVVCLANFKDVKYNYEETKQDLPDNPESVDEEEDEETEDPSSLMYKLNHIKSWDEFNAIAIDAASAFAGSHNFDTPVMAGFLYNDKKDDTSHIKIDQYMQYEEDLKGNHGVYLSPGDDSVYETLIVRYGKITDEATDPIYYTLDEDENKVMVNKGMTLHMRRLVANINVEIDVTAPNLELTETTYKRFNMPTSVYIIERRTTDCEIISEKYTDENNKKRIRYKVNPESEAMFSHYKDKGEYDKKFSPNYSDLNPETGYTNDTEWQPTQTKSFSFQHFANKHWSDMDVEKITDKDGKFIGYKFPKRNGQNNNEVDDDKDRYKRTDKNGTSDVFTVLMGPDATTPDFRNYASYFVVKMHLVDKNTGKAFEAEYTIFEGNTSDELGNQIYDDYNKPVGTPKDFVCARNINYFYKITIAGADKIYHNVTKDYPDHSSGQGGKVWEFRYVNNSYLDTGELDPDPKAQNCRYEYETNSFINPISHEGGVYENAVVIKNKEPQLCFRLYGYNLDAKKADGTDDPRIEGFNYNFSDDSFKNLRGLWPESSGSYSHYYHDSNDLEGTGIIDANGNIKGIPKNMLDGLRFIKAEGDYANFSKVQDNIEEILKEYKSDNNGLDGRKVLDVKQLMLFYINGKTSDTDDKWHMWVSASNIPGPISYTERRKYVRAIYIADRKGETDFDGCTTLINVFAAAQYPEFNEATDADRTRINLTNFNNIDINKYYVIDQYVSDFSVPLIRGLDPAYYNYVLTIDDQEYTIEDTDHVSVNGSSYTYKNIPLSSVTNGEIFLQAKVTGSGREAMLLDSDIKRIGRITVTNHPAWEYNEPEWESAISWFKTHTGWADSDKFQSSYLSFFFDVSTSGVSLRKFDPYHEDNNKVSYFRCAGANWIAVTIYGPCKITATARTQNVKSSNQRRLDIKLNKYTNIVKEGYLTTTAASGDVGKWDTVTCTIDSNTREWEDGENVVYFNSANGEIAISSIKIEKP